MSPCPSTPALFARFAKDDPKIWRSAIGQLVNHKALGYGEITNIYQHPHGDGLRVTIDFTETAQTKTFVISSRSSGKPPEEISVFMNSTLTDMSLPEDLQVRLEEIRPVGIEHAPISTPSNSTTQSTSKVQDTYPEPQNSIVSSDETPLLRAAHSPFKISFAEFLSALKEQPTPTQQRPVPQLAQPDRPIYHITHLANLNAIIAAGCLWSDCEVDYQIQGRTRIGHAHLKDKRMYRSIPIAPGSFVGDYVPFYFAPRSPMLYAIGRGEVTGYSDGQQPILYLTSSINCAIAADLPWVFSNGNATSERTSFYDDATHLEQVNWSIMDSRYWTNTATFPDRKRQRQAEFLTRRSFPWSLITMVGVIDEAVADEVRHRLRGHTHQPQVCVQRNWYY